MKAKGIVSKPKISLNKLAEYLEANVTRRKAIVYDAKYPQKFKTTRYSEARIAINTFLKDKKGEEYLLGFIDKLKSKTVKTPFEQNNYNNSIAAIESVLSSELVGALDDFDLVSVPSTKGEYLNIKGVLISIAPDLLIKNKNGEFGCFKLHISKSNALTKEGQLNVNVLLDHFNSEILQLKEPNKKISASFDVFLKTLEFSPTATAMRFRKIEDTCEEIGLWWDRV